MRLRPILACSFDHPKCQDEKKKEKMKHKEERKKRKGGTVNTVRVSVKASPAEGRRRLHTNTAYVRLSGFNGPSCGASPALGFSAQSAHHHHTTPPHNTTHNTHTTTQQHNNNNNNNNNTTTTMTTTTTTQQQQQHNNNTTTTQQHNPRKWRNLKKKQKFGQSRTWPE